MFKNIIAFFKSLNSNSHPGEIAHAVCIGMILGFTPKDNVFWYLLTIFFLFIRINKASMLIFTFLFALLAPSLDNIFDTVGYNFLTIEKLSPTFSFLLDIPFVAFTKFNNSIVIGSFLISLISYIPLYFISRIFIKYWRAFIAPAVRKTKIISLISKIPLIKKIGDMV